MNALLPVKVNAHWCQEQTITTRNTTTKSQQSVLPRSCSSTGHQVNPMPIPSSNGQKYPSNWGRILVAVTNRRLRRYGHSHRDEIGITVQPIVPNLAIGLGLSRYLGVIVSDVHPGGSADAAGLKEQDIIVSVDDKQVNNVPSLAFYLDMLSGGERVKLGILRGSEKLFVGVLVIDRPHQTVRLADEVDPDQNFIGKLGVLGVEINSTIAQMLPDLRVPSGVLVAAKDADSRRDVSLVAGDVIHAINGVTVSNLNDLRSVVNGLKPNSSVALQIEREGNLMFVSFALFGDPIRARKENQTSAHLRPLGSTTIGI